MHKVEAGLLFTDLAIIENDLIDSKIAWVKFGLDMDSVNSFWAMDNEQDNLSQYNGTTKIYTDDGEYYVVKIPFDKFTEIIIKHRNSFKGIMN